MMLNLYLEGFFLQASLIFVLGAQNLFVLESGLTRQYPFVVSFTCFICDLILIMLGAAGAATIMREFPQIKIIIGIFGIIFLFHYGLGRIFSGEGKEIELQNFHYSLKDSILKSLAFSLINPHAYLDGIVLIGGQSAKYDELFQRMILGWGAASFSLVWFLLLSTASTSMIPIFQNPRRMKFLMCTAGISLIFLSGKLSIEVYSWIREGGFAFDGLATLH